MVLINVFTVHSHFIFCSTFVVQHSVHGKKLPFLAAMLMLARTAVLTFSMNVVISFKINLLLILKMCHLHVACESYLKQFVVPYGN